MNDNSLTMKGSLPYLILNFLFHTIFFMGSIRNNLIFAPELLSSCSMYFSNILLYICLFITNWVRLVLVYLLPLFVSMTSSVYICLIEGFFFHVCSLFYVSMVLLVQLYWHYCLLSNRSIEKFNICRFLSILLCIFLGLCLLTFPSINQEWSSMTFDPILNICLIDYRFKTSYTFFIIMITCMIPFVLMIISQQMQSNSIDHQHSELSTMKRRLRYSSCSMLVWYSFNILLIISLHFPFDQIELRRIVFDLQLLSFLIEPIFCLFVFRFMSKVILFQSFDKIYFIQ